MARVVYVPELGRSFSFKDGASDQDISAYLEGSFKSPEAAAPAPPPEEGMGAWESSGLGWLSRFQTAGGGVAEAVGAEDYAKWLYEKAQKNLDESSKYQPKEPSITGAETWSGSASALGDAAIQSAPDLAGGLGAAYLGGKIGAGLGAAGGPLTAGLGALIGAGVGGMGYAFGTSTGSNIQRQAQEQGTTLEEADESKAMAAAAVQAPLDFIADRIILGRLIPSGTPTNIVKKIVGDGVIKHAGKGFVAEGLTETAQQAIELYQANPEKLFSLSPEVQAELADAAIAGGFLGGVAGGVAKPLERIADYRRGAPQRQLQQDIASESQRNAQLARQGEIARVSEDLRNYNVEGPVIISEEEVEGDRVYQIKTPAGNTFGKFSEPDSATEAVRLYQERTGAKISLAQPVKAPSAFPVKINNKTFESIEAIQTERDNVAAQRDAVASFGTNPETVKAQAAAQGVSEAYYKSAVVQKEVEKQEAILKKLDDFLARARGEGPVTAEPVINEDTGEAEPDVNTPVDEDAGQIELPIEEPRVLEEEAAPVQTNEEVPPLRMELRTTATTEQLADLQQELFDTPKNVREMSPEELALYEAERDKRYPPKEVPVYYDAGVSTARPKTISEVRNLPPNPREYTPEYKKAMDAVYTELKSRINSIAPGVGINLDTLIANKPGYIVRGAAEERQTPDGLKSFIDLATGYMRPGATVEEMVRDLVGTMNHEAIHVLRTKGLLRPAEWRILSKAVENAKVPGRKYTYLDKAQAIYEPMGGVYANPDAVVEEAVAEMYKDWVAGKGAPVQTRGLFNRITEFLRRIFRVLQNKRYEDVLKRIEDGEVGRRPLDPRGREGVRFSIGETYEKQNGRNRDGSYSSGDLAPLDGAPQGAGQLGPDPRLVAVAEKYAAQSGIDLKRQGEYVQVNEVLARRIADAYDKMPHAPQDPAVKEAYADLIRQTKAQYDALTDDGYVFTFFDSNSDPYRGNPWNAMRDLRANKRMAVYGTYDGYGTDGITGAAVDDNPMLADTGLRWPDQSGVLRPVAANDLFRAVHDAFGHGLEGAGFRARGEENAWQAHVRLFTGPAVGAITSETRGQNSWLNFGPYGEKNLKALLEDTVFAEQKTGLMPSWTWEEGRAGDFDQGTKRFSAAPAGAPLSTNLEDRSSKAFQLYPYLRSASARYYDHKAKILSGTNPGNAARQIQNLDQLLAAHPNTLASDAAWADYVADAMGKDATIETGVPIIPYKAVQFANNPDLIVRQLGSMTPGQLDMAEDGLSAAKDFERAYRNGSATPMHTAKLILWGILSRGVSPFVQESMFLDVVNPIGVSNRTGRLAGNIDQFIQDAIEGQFDLNAYRDYVRTLKIDGLPGAGTTHNLGAFGTTTLVKLQERVPDGRTILEYLHDLIGDYNLSGKQIRRLFHEVNPGIGINNKVLSFMMLVSGRDDVMVLDRVQMRNQFNDGRFDDYNLYDGVKVEKLVTKRDGTQKLENVTDTGSGMAKLGDGVRGLMYYEALERDLTPAVREAYNRLNRGNQFSMGRYHWESWVATSAQEVDHGSVSGLIKDALGELDPYTTISTGEGKYDTFNSGIKYGYTPQGEPVIGLPDGLGRYYNFTPEYAKKVIAGYDKRSTGIIRDANFRVSTSTEGPWYDRPEVNKDKLRSYLQQKSDEFRAERGRTLRKGVQEAGPNNANRPGPGPVHAVRRRGGLRQPPVTNPREGARFSAAPIENDITWTPERIDREIRSSHYGDGRSKAYVAWINPESFLDATATADEAIRGVIDDGSRFYNQLHRIANNEQSPFLIMDGKNVVGHEGRHRMAALSRKGVTYAPVVVLDRDGGKMREPIGSLTLGPQGGNKGNAVLSNLIPLNEKYRSVIEEQMNKPKSGMRFSAAPALSSDEFKRWFRKSRVVNEDGSPKVLYHGTNARVRFTTFDTVGSELGSHFGTQKQSAKFVTINEEDAEYRQGGRIYPVYLSLQNPLRLKDMGNWDNDKVASQLLDLGMIDDATFESMIPDYGRGQGDFVAKERKNREMLQRIIKMNGYDGIVYLNRFEGLNSDPEQTVLEGFNDDRELNQLTDSEFRSYLSEAEDSYIVFAPTQVKSIFNEFNPGEARRLRFSAAPLPSYIESKNDTLFAPAPKMSFAKMAFEFLFGARPMAKTLHTMYGDIDLSSPKMMRLMARGAAVDSTAFVAELEKLANEKLTGNYERELADTSATVALAMHRRSSHLNASMLMRGKLELDFSRPGDIQSATVKAVDDPDSMVNILKILMEPGPVDSRTQEAKDKRDVFKSYATAIRARNKAAAGLQTPGEVDATYINTIIPFTQQNYPEVVRAYEMYQRFNRNLLKTAVQAGLMDQRTYNNLIQNMDYYGFYREVYETPVAPSISTKTASEFKLRAFKGSDHGNLMNDPVYVMIHNAQFWVSAITRNIAAQKAFKLSRDMGVARILASDEKPDPARDEEDQVMFFRENGIQKRFAVSDPLLVAAIGADDRTDIGRFWQLVGMPTTILRETVTRDPAFMIANLMRDTLSAWITSGEDFTPVIGTVKGFAKAYKNGASYQALMGRGIVGSYDLAMLGPQELASKLRNRAMPQNVLTVNGLAGGKAVVGGLWNRLGALSEYSDAATRIAVYEAARAKGLSEAEAAFRAIEILDFSRRGGSQAISILTKMIPFLNARIQGMDVLYQAGKAGAKVLTGRAQGDRERNIGKKFLVRGALLAAISVALEIMNEDDEDYQQLDDYIKNSNMLVPLSAFGLKGQFLAYPKPFEAGLLFSTFPQQIYKATQGNASGRDTAKLFFESMASTFGVNPIPQAILPLMEIRTNHDFYTGLPLISEGKARLAPELQYNSSTSQLAMMIGKIPIWYDMTSGRFEGASPIVIDNLISGYGGPVGSYLAQAVGLAMEGANIGPERLPRDLTQLPVVKRFMIDSEAKNPKAVTQAYELFRIVDEANRSFSRLRQTGDAEATLDYLNENRDVLSYKKYVFKLVDRLNKLSAHERAIERDTTMSDDEKREAMRKLREVRIRLASKVKEINQTLGR